MNTSSTGRITAGSASTIACATVSVSTGSACVIASSTGSLTADSIVTPGSDPQSPCGSLCRSLSAESSSGVTPSSDPQSPSRPLSKPLSAEEFKREVLRLVGLWEPRLGVQTSFVGIRKMRTRWGSCTPRTRRIRINAALMDCPPECLEYVIVHELAHIREPNHSKVYWKLVESALPDYRERKKTLRSMRP